MEKQKSSLATAGMVLGIIAIVFSFIPVVNVVSIILGVLALVFGGVSLLKKRGVGKSIAAVVLGLLSIVIAITMLVSLGNAVNEAVQPTQTSESSQSEPEGAEATTGTFDGAAAFDKVKNGMSKQEVRDIAGVDPTSCTENQDDVLGTTEYCSYGNMFVDDVTFDVIYSQGAVSSKTKSTH